MAGPKVVSLLISRQTAAGSNGDYPVVSYLTNQITRDRIRLSAAMFRGKYPPTYILMSFHRSQ